MADRMPDDETTREIRVKAYYHALPARLAGPKLLAALESLNASRRLLLQGAGEADCIFVAIVGGVLGAALDRGDLATFEEQCLAFAQDVRWLSDNARNRHFLQSVLQTSFARALSAMSGRRSQKFLDRVLPKFAVQTATRLCHLAYVSILDAAVRTRENREEARRLLERALSVERQTAEDEDISDAILQCMVLYWSLHEKPQNQRFADDAEVVITQASDNAITAEARLLAANGGVRKQICFQVLPCK
jgi:hypothetical protein